jgi:hypothetical protein
MCNQLRVECIGCTYFCNPKPLTIEQLIVLIKTNSKVSDALFNLEAVVLVCPLTGSTLFAHLE